MAFTGTAIIKKVTDKCYRITGVSLAGNADELGSIGFSDKTVPANVSIAAIDWDPYEINGDLVSLVDMVQVEVRQLNISSGSETLRVGKSGTTRQDFQININNYGVSATGPLEIYVSKTS